MRLAEGVDAPGTGRDQKLSGNRVWWNRALQAAAVRSINGIPNPFPFSRTHIRGMIGDFGRGRHEEDCRGAGRRMFGAGDARDRNLAALGP